MDEIALLTAFALPEERPSALKGLAQRVGAEDAILFVQDPLLDALLPAPGLLQTLPSGEWRSFLCDTAHAASRIVRALPYPERDTKKEVFGIRADDGSILVLIAPNRLDEAALKRLLRFLPLLAAAPRQELLTLGLQQRMQAATESAERARALAHNLDEARLELQVAYHTLHATERTLVDERERLSVTLHSIGDAVISTDTDGRITLMNEAAESCTGWSREDALGRPLTQVAPLIDEHTRLPQENPVTVVLRTQMTAELSNHTFLVRRDGSLVSINDSAAPIRTRQGEMIGVVLVFRDISEKRRLEDELIKTQRLESIGILAGGIAHDFNNILTAVLGYVGLAKLYGSALPKVGQMLLESENAILRARELTRKLLTFAKGGAPIRQKGVLSEPLTESLTLLAMSGHTVALDIAADLWPCEFDNGQLSQVFTNLILNAQEATNPPPDPSKPARIQVRAYNDMNPRKTATFRGRSGPYVHIEVKDDGIGIQEEAMPHIFEPFFTTKGGGTGLGLATTYSIVKRHDGYIYAEPHLPRGTIFHVLLPASEASHDPLPNDTQTP